MERILEDLPNLFKKSLFRDLRENRNILLHILYMNINLVGICLILRRCRLYNGIKNRLLTRKVVVVKGWCLDTNRFCDLSHTDGIIAFCQKQLPCTVEDLFMAGFNLSKSSVAENCRSINEHAYAGPE